MKKGGDGKEDGGKGVEGWRGQWLGGQKAPTNIGMVVMLNEGMGTLLGLIFLLLSRSGS